MKDLCADLLGEYRALAGLCATLSPQQWRLRTDFYGWTPWDEVAHLLFFDETALLAVTDPPAFEADKERLVKQQAAGEEISAIARRRFGHLDGAALLALWRERHEALVAELAKLDAKARLPWYGPTMSARSFATARLMETWAHGQDVWDALGRDRPPTPGLRHITHLGVTTYGWTFVNRQLPVPQPVPYVELEAPDGSRWSWGEPSTTDSVRGPALDFALLVTQRRHRADTALQWAGESAEQWTRIAQCFAGPPADGPAPGVRKRKDAARKTVRIGGASGFWGDSMVGAPQLVKSGQIDYLVFDYLAETTMAILAGMKRKKPELGYATDFVDIAMRQVLPDVMQRGIKVIANAGGIHPQGCAQALQALADSLGLQPRIAVVEGDDVSSLMGALRDEGTRDMFTGEPLPAQVLSASAYLGALPVARALAAGADIVITGRGVDSAVTLGALIHEFHWSPQDYDRLAGGSLAGHIIECGCQATGGLFTDWEQVPDWAHIGYPILDCFDDGSFELTKPAGTGGLIHPACVAEQMLYEIGDPGAYLLPDVSCDFRSVRMEQVAPDRVRVTGARGRAPTESYKVSATQLDGWRCAGMMAIVGIDAARKARRTGEAILERTRELLRAAGLGDFTRVQLELFGAETLYGASARGNATREAMVRVVVDHPDKKALEIFAREIAPAGTSWSPGTTMPSGGRPSPSPLVKPFSFLLDKARVPVQVRLGGEVLPVAVPAGERDEPGAPTLPEPVAWSDPPGEAQVDVPLVKLAWARSGDKGNIANIGVIARRPEWLPLLWDRLTTEVVRAHFAHMAQGRVERFHLPGIAAINFMLHDALAGGGPASARFDPLGKGNAQILLDLPVRVPASVAALV